MRRLPVIAACVGLVAASATANAQRARGVIRDSIASAPIGGAVVVVVDSSGVATARAITDSAGAFVVSLGPRTERLRVVRIGYRPLVVSAIQARNTSVLELRLGRIPPMLDAVRVDERSLCPGSADRGSAFDALEQVRAGLLGQVASIEAGAVEAEGLLYRRTLGVSSPLIESQVVETRTGRSLRPFVAVASPKTFAERGYMQEDAGGRTFGAVDADVVLDESFAATHCFRLSAKDPSHVGEVGLSFAPIPGRDTLVDVAGVVWLEENGRELRSIDFRYTNLEPAALKVGAGGQIAFQTATNGQSFIERWHLTLPVLTEAPNATRPSSRRRASRTDLRVSEIRENGGILLSAKWSGGTRWSAPRTGVAGTVRVVRSERSVAMAIVSIEGASSRAVADSSGGFAIAPLPPGRYKVIATDTTYAAFLKPRGTTAIVEVSFDGMSPVLLSVDAPDTTRVRALMRAELSKVRNIAGVVTDSGQKPIRGAEIRIRGGAVAVTNNDGSFRLPDVSRDAVLIEARHVGFAPIIFGVATGSDTSVAITLAPLAQELEAVKVSERQLGPEHLRAFNERMHARERGAGGGFFITTAEIERRDPPRTTSVFDNVPGIHVLRVGPRNFSLFGDSRSLSDPLSQKCNATVFLDGIKLQSGGDVLRMTAKDVVVERGVAIDQMVDPSNIAGIEVYASPNTAPTQYQAVNNGCSIILIWTKSGGR